MLCVGCGRRQIAHYQNCPYCKIRYPIDHPDNPRPIEYSIVRIVLFCSAILILCTLLVIGLFVDFLFGAAIMMFILIPWVLWFPFFLINPDKWHRFLKKEFRDEYLRYRE